LLTFNKSGVEVVLGRIIKTESAGKDRTRLSKEVVLAIRELMKQNKPDDTSKDIAAFIALALEEIAQTIDVSVAAWEKRGYWVKADRFRLDWGWSGKQGELMRQAIVRDDWVLVAQVSIQVAQKLSAVQIAEHHRLGIPWTGSWLKFTALTKR
jgi:hypothetical protein